MARIRQNPEASAGKSAILVHYHDLYRDLYHDMDSENLENFSVRGLRWCSPSFDGRDFVFRFGLPDIDSGVFGFTFWRSMLWRLIW